MKEYDKLDDNALAALAQEGDALAESALVKRHTGLAKGISRSYFLTGGDEDDLFQIALLALLYAVRNFKPEKGAEFSTYASACIRNRMIDAVRSASAGKNSFINDGLRIEDDDAAEGGVSLGELASPELSPEQYYIEKEAEEAFYDALSRALGENDMNVIRLYLASMPYKEISEKLGISVKKVDNVIYGAKKKIARLIEELKN